MKLTHKFLAVILIIALLASLLLMPKIHRNTQNTEALYQQLSQCLFYYDSLYESILWSLDYAQEYTTKTDWAALSRARAACTAAKVAIMEEPLLDNTVSMEQYLELLHNNVESDLVYSLWEDIQEEATQFLQIMHSLESFVYEQIHFYEMTPRLETWISDCRAYIQAHCKYLTLITNYLLLQMDMESRWATLSEQMPTIYSFSQDLSTDKTLITEQYAKAHEEYNACYLRMEDLDSICSYSKRLESIATSISHRPSVSDVMAPYMWQIPDIPAYFPMPEWLENTLPSNSNITETNSVEEEIKEQYEEQLDELEKQYRSSRGADYASAEETDSAQEEIPTNQITVTWQYEHLNPDSQKVQQLHVGDKLQDAPTLCRITVQHLPQEEIESYCRLLEECGLTPLLQMNKEGNVTTLEVTSTICRLQITWTEQETVLLLTESIGCLIPATYLKAIRAQ